MLEIKLHDNEQVQMTLRKHPLILVGQLIPFIFLDYLPYLLPKLGVFLDSIGAAAGASAPVSYAALFSFGNAWVDFLVGVYWLFVWMGAFGTFTNYFLDQWIITNERVIDINQVGFWNREVSSVFLNRVQNVETEVQGFFHTIFGYGTVVVESAGAEAHLVRMTGLPHPTRVRDHILEQISRLHEADLHPDAKTGL